MTVRLHPSRRGTRPLWRQRRPRQTGGGRDPARGTPLEADSLDAAWQGGSGRLLAHFGGATAGDQAEATAARMREAGLDGVQTVEDDEDLWDDLRAAQRRPEVCR